MSDVVSLYSQWFNVYIYRMLLVNFHQVGVHGLPGYVIDTNAFIDAKSLLDGKMLSSSL